MISRVQIMPMLIKACSSFEDPWQEYTEYLIYEESIFFSHMSEFAKHIVDLLKNGETSEFKDIFSTIELLIVEGDADVRNLMVVGLLEDIQNLAWGKVDRKSIYLYLGPESAKSWDDLIAQWEPGVITRLTRRVSIRRNKDRKMDTPVWKDNIYIEMERYLDQLILQMGSSENEVACEAISQLRVYGWVKDGSLAGTNLEGANLKGANLMEADLSEAQLMGANLEGANLRRANLNETNLHGVNLIQSDLSESSLWEANLGGAQMMKANFEDANFWEANLEAADLEGANLTRVDFLDANLAGANLRSSNLIGADLMGANLVRADLKGANLEGAELKGANIEYAILEEAHISPEQLASYVSLRGAIMPDGTIFRVGDMKDSRDES